MIYEDIRMEGIPQTGSVRNENRCLIRVRKGYYNPLEMRTK